MARIYTRTGDGGETSLADGTRTPKSGSRVDLYGEVDELICQLGFCTELLRERPEPEAADLAVQLIGIQNRLFTLASVLADPRRDSDASLPATTARILAPPHLEQAIDALDEKLPPLTQFILPGGGQASAALHVARAVCRRAERKAAALAAVESLPDLALTYLNRLSDYLFTAARAAAAAGGEADRIWRQDEGASD